MKLSEFKAIIFDSDGVLVDSEIIHIAVEREFLGELGLHYANEEYLTRFVGLSNPDYYRALQKDFEARVGGVLPRDFGARLQARTAPRMESELRAITGVSQLVQAFGGPVAVASSAPVPKLRHKLELAELATVFAPHIYSADHVKHGKPAPDLFLHAAAMIGVEPQGCVVIEDSVHGVAAARAAQMTAIGFVGGSHADKGLRNRLFESGAAYVAGSHAEIQQLL